MPNLVEKIMDRLKGEYGIPDSRRSGRPIDSLIRVILSQNTNSKNTSRAFESLMEEFDTAEEVMEADTHKIADAISVAGLYNTKSKRIKETLVKINEEKGSLDLDFLDDMSLEDAREWLMELPGVGPKSASVVLNFRFDKAAFPVDTHVYRVSKRLGVVPDNLDHEGISKEMEDQVPEDRMFEFHVNLIKHGRKVCKSRKPLCSECVLPDLCDYYAREIADN